MRQKKADTGDMRIVDRLRYILFDMNKNETQMSRECGISMGAISGAKRPGRDLTELLYRRILDKYPFINEAWLLRGEGERYKDGRVVNEPITINAPAIVGDGNAGNCVGARPAAADGKLVEFLMNQNVKLQEQIDSLTELLRATIGAGGPKSHAQNVQAAQDEATTD